MKTLRTTLRINGAFSAICGLYLTVAHEEFSPSLGIIDSVWVMSFGIVLVLFALSLFITARTSKISNQLVTAIVILDLGYVLGAFGYAAFLHKSMDAKGILFVIVTGLAVLIFAYKQWRLTPDL